MHTSSGVDVVDEFAEKVERRGKAALLPVRQRRAGRSASRPVTIRYRTPDGSFATRSFTTYLTHHGPIVRADDGRWIAFAMMNRPVEALQQSFLRTKATRPRLVHRRSPTLQGQQLEQHPLRRRQGRDRLSPPAVRARAATTASTIRGRSTAAIRRPTGTGCTRSPSCRTSLNPPNGWVQNTNNWP